MSRKIYIVGLGPGDNNQLTIKARECLDSCDTIVGYTVYINMVKPYYKNKEYISTPMKSEIERCRRCFLLAMEGKKVALVCSGDAGIYGMASPMYELLGEYEDIELEIVPGVTAAISGAALLGAPINHDFCVISLSDLLTSKDVIEKRLRAAIQGDFAIVLYNPSSKKRRDYLKWACEIMISEGADKNRCCGYVRCIGRDGQEVETMHLVELQEFEADMFTTIFIGNSESFIENNKLITKRGYKVE